MSEEKTQVQNARKDLDILNKMKNLPGGLVIIPLVIAVVLATFVPQVFQIGGYVTALFYEGNACMMVSMATAQCATASIITLFLCPFITAAFDKWMQKRQKGIYSPEGWAYDKVKAN